MITYGSTTLTSYNTITKIEVYYYKSTSATSLSGGSWSTTKPTWENGKYIWQKIRTTYEGKLENGQYYSESDPVNITGQQGATGTAAYSYKLNASDTAVTVSKTGEYSVNKITFTATYKQGTGAVTAYAGRFKIETTLNGTTWTTAYTSSDNESSKQYTLSENIISIRCSLYQAGGTSVLLDTITIPIVNDDRPIVTKTYTGLIGSANDAANASFYFAKVYPTSYATNYKVKMKVRVTVPEAYAETIDIQFGGYGSTFSSYDAYTTRTGSTGIYYINLYKATQAGISTNHKGHALGVGLRSSTNPTNTSYKRTIIVDILELENCTIEMLDTAVKYANIDGTGSTNYSGLTEMGVATAGQNATNNTNTSYTQYANAVKAGTFGVKRYTLLMKDSENTWSSFINQANSIATTKTVCQGGFLLGKLLYSAGGAEYASGANTSTVYDAYPFDFRYSTNCGQTLISHQPVYLVGTIENDRLFYLDVSQWWTQTKPTYADGKVYVYVGMAYSTYQIWLNIENPAYVYYNSEFILYDKAVTLQNIASLKDSLETQIDSKVETWCQKTNPASSWTAEERPNHTGDLWYYIGESTSTYKNNTTYQYNGDTNTWSAYSANPDLFDKIDGKTAIYYGTTSSVTSAEKGDYLVDSTDGSSYRWDGSKWVKVTDYKTAIDTVNDAIVSRGEQLVINGNGMMGSNYNFSSLTFDGSKSNGSPGSFTRPAETISRTIYSDEFFPVTPSNTYVLSFDLMSLNNLSTMYAFINFYDVDKKQIDAEMHMYCPNTLTTLSQDLKNGDTVVHLTDASNWETTGSYNHGLIFWNYVNSFGYQYPEHTYSRNKWDKLFDLSNIDKTNNTITLNEAWNHGTFPTGTKLSQKNAGATFKYLGITGSVVPNTWTSYKGRIGDIDYSGNNMMGMFPPGTAYAKVGFLWNYNKANDQIWVTNISVKEDVTRGTGFYAITTAPTAYTTQVGNFTPAYRIALSTVKTQSGLEEIMVGDVIQQGYNTYPVGYVDTSYVYLGSANSIRGATGATGLNNAQVILYRRFASAPSGTNVAPTGDVTYTFSTGKATNNLNSWTQNIPSGSDPVYMIAASASSTSSTDTIPKTEWSAPVKILENGQDGGTGSAGADGYNQATIFLYQRKSGTAPSKPSSAVTYTFSSGALSSTPTGWSRTIPANNGNPCYVTTATAVAKTATYSIPANGWSDVVILSQDGEDGASITITSTSVKYQKGTSGTTAPTGTWGTSIPTVGENEFLWTQTIVNYSDNSKTESYSVSRNAKNGTNGTSPTVSSTTVEYQQSTGGTTPPTGTWSTTAPTATAGQYMWTRTTVTYSDSKTAVSYSVSKNGTNGTSPTAYHLIVSHGAINKSQAGVYNPTTITLTSKYQTGNGALNNYSGRFKIETTTDNNTWTQDSASSTANESSKTYTIPANIKAVRFSLYLAGGFTTLLDQQTVPVVTDGAKGDNGEDAYTIVLTNEAHTFPAGVSAALAGSATSNVMTYKGGVQVACFVGSTSSATSISTGTTGLTCTINDNNSKNVSLTFTATTSLTTKAGTVTIPITVDNKAFSKTFTWSLANQGIKGEDGVSVTNVTSTNNTADGGTSVVTITLSNGTTKTFNVKNGSKGSQGDTGATAEWYYGTALTHISGSATLSPSSTSGAVVGSMYLNTKTSLVYKCTAVGTNNTWTYAGDLITGVIDNLQVGGKNLLLKEPRSFNPTVYNPYQLNLTEPLEANQPYTIQLWDVDVSNDKKTASQLGVNVYYCGDTVTFGNWTGEQYFTNGHADHLTLTFTPTEANVTHSSVNNTTGAKYISLYNSVPNVDGSVKNLTVGKWQLEKGNVGTDWTLAPEDVENAIQNAQDKADEAWAATQPLAIKTYNNVIITNNNDPQGWLYFGTVKPTNYNTPWKIRYKVYASINGVTDSYQQSEVMIEGAKDTYYTYRTYNMISNTNYRPLYAYSLYTLKQAGVNNGYGHLIGIRFQSAYWPNSTYTNYKRTIKIEIIESTNCQITLADTMFLYADASGTGSTNYNTRYSFDGTTQGYTGSGDRNETNHILNNFSGKTGVLGIWSAGLFMRDGNGTYQNICTDSAGAISRTVNTTKKPNPNGFEIGSQIYYSPWNTYNANSNINGSVYASYGAFDSRYSLNTTLTTNCLTPYEPVYLVGTVRTDGLYYLDTVWWTQTPTDSSKTYVLIGGCYDSTTSYCRINLFEDNNWYKYVNGKLEDYTNRLAELASTTATAYITDTTNNGIMVHPENDTTSGWSIAGAIELFKSGISYIKLWIDNNIPKIRIGKEDSKHVLIDDDSVDIVDDEDVLASFGETAIIGKKDNVHLQVGSTGIYGQNSNNSNDRFFEISQDNGVETIESQQDISEDFSRNNTVTKQFTIKLSENKIDDKIKYLTIVFDKRTHISLYDITGEFSISNLPQTISISPSSGSYSGTITISEKDENNNLLGTIVLQQEDVDLSLECFSRIYYSKLYTTPSFTFGSRIIDSKYGGYSTVNGLSNIASGNYSYAGGKETIAEGDSSFAMGSASEARENYSVAIGDHVIAKGNNQTVIGCYNKEDDESLFVIGNGMDIPLLQRRSNALTVDQTGNIFMHLSGSSTSSPSSDTTDGLLYSAITALGWENDVITT